MFLSLVPNSFYQSKICNLSAVVGYTDEVFHSAGKKLPSEDSDDEFADPDYFPPALTHRTYSMVS